VTSWRAVERDLHYAFRSKLDRSIKGQKELFALSPVEASSRLNGIDESLVVRRPKIDRMFQDQGFASFLQRLFRFSGLLNWLDLQGAWTLNLFPTTNGPRYFTLNIGKHEVAFSTAPVAGHAHHMMHMDRLIFDFPAVRSWVKAHRGQMMNDSYATALHRSTSVFFEGGFTTALEFLDLQGVRRAMIAYWTEALIGLQERGSLSVHARHHNWNAVREIKRRMELDV
jgi:hypothetical protein